LQYEDEDGRVEVFPPCGLPEAEEERLELALCARSADLFAETGLFVPCAGLDATARATESSPRTHSCAPMSGTDSSGTLSGKTMTVRPVR
jgi:hypothetical protein